MSSPPLFWTVVAAAVKH